MKMFVAPVVALEISDPPTTPRGVARSSADGFTSLMSRSHTGELAAGDVEHLTVHEVRPRGAEEEDAAGGLRGRAAAAERDQHRLHRAHLVGDPELHPLAVDLHRVRVVLRRRQARLDPTEGDRVDVDLELAPLLRQRLRQPDDGGLAGRVVRLAGVAHRARDRGYVDDLAEHLAPLLALLLRRLAQVRGRGADHAERHHRVDVEHALERVVAHLVDRGVDRVAGVVDDDVDLAPRVDRGLHERVRGARLRQVARVDDGLARDLGGRLLGDVAVEVVDHDVRAVLAQQLGRRPADAARRSGDDRHLVVEYAHGSSWFGFGRRILPQSPYERPITSSMISSVPAPMRLSRMSRHTRSMPYSFM